MAWLLVTRRSYRQATAWAAAGVGSLLAGGLVGALRTAPGGFFWTSVGFVSYVVCVGRAVRIWRADEMVFDHGRRGGRSTETERRQSVVRERRHSPGRQRSWRLV